MRFGLYSARFVVLVLAILGGGVSLHPQAQSKLDPLLQQRLADPLGESRIIVTVDNTLSLDALAVLITEAGGVPGRRLPLINGQTASVPNAALALLALNPAVQHLALDRPIAGTLERTAAAVHATAAREAFGIDGAGIGIAVIDSGITPWHDDLADPARPGSQRVAQFVDLVDDTATASDDYGHGTHVAGIITGNGFDSNGARTGIAPAAHLVVLKVLNGAGQGRISDVIAAFDYVVAHKAEFNIRIANLSIAAGVYESFHLDPLTVAARRVVESGIVVIAAAGNLGRRPDGSTQYGAVTAPGNAPWVLTVGASSHMGTIDRSDDTIAAFSSRGPTAIDRIPKPDLVAPGVGIESLSLSGSYLYESRPAYLLSGTVPTPSLPYMSLSGTSMAAPVVSGAVALMLQVNPTLTPNAVKAILQYTSQPSNAYDVMAQGAGFLNVRGAVQLAAFFASPTTTYPTDASWGKKLIWGKRHLWGGRIYPNVLAWATGEMWGAPDANSLMTWSGLVLGLEQGEGIIWGTSDGDSVVWGTEGGDSVVWGTEGGDSVVWGTSDEGDSLVWGTSGCRDPSCDVIW
jgi:serine protease AprX